MKAKIKIKHTSSDFIKSALISLAPKRELNEVLGTTLELLREKYNLDSAAVFLYGTSHDYLKLESQFGLSAQFINKLIVDSPKNLNVKEFSPIPENDNVFIQENLVLDQVLRNSIHGERTKHKLIILTLKVDGTITGYIWLIKKEPFELHPKDIQVLEESCSVFSVLFNKSQLYREMFQTVEQLEKLVNVQNALLVDLDINSILKRAMNEIINLFNPDTAEIIILKDELLESCNQAGSIVMIEKDTPEFSAHQKMIKYLEEKKDFVIFNNTGEEEPRFPYGDQYKIMSAVVLPILIENKIEGFLLIGKNSPRFFRLEDIPLYAAFPLIISKALYTGKLHQNILNLQDHLFQASKMESIGILAGGISHDFNNALAGLISAADLIEMSINDDPKLLRFVQIIQNSGHRMANWTKQLLAYAKGGFFTRMNLILNQSIIDAVNIVQDSINKKISIILKLDPGLMVIDADPDGMKQVVTNILLNSGEAISEYGEIAVYSENVMKDDSLYNEKKLDTGKEYIRLLIKDTGCGIDEKVAERIFDPFVTTKFAGRGLGLSAVFGIVRRHEGKIYINSKAGEGTSVEIFLPVSEKIQQEQRLPEKSVMQQPVILVVSIFDVEQPNDDKILTSLGGTLIQCYDIDAAISILENRNDINLTFIDSQYPELTLEKILPLIMNTKKKMKILVSIAEKRQQEISGMFKDLSPIFIYRPFDQLELLSLIKRMFDN